MANTAPTITKTEADKINAQLKELSKMFKSIDMTPKTITTTSSGEKLLKKVESEIKKPTSVFNKMLAKSLETPIIRGFAKGLAIAKISLGSYVNRMSGILSGVMRTTFGKLLDDLSPVIEFFKATIDFAKNMVFVPLKNFVFNLAGMMASSIWKGVTSFLDRFKKDPVVEVVKKEVSVQTRIFTRLRALNLFLRKIEWNTRYSTKTSLKAHKTYKDVMTKEIEYRKKAKKDRLSKIKDIIPTPKTSTTGGEGGIISKVISMFSVGGGILGFLGMGVAAVLFKGLWDMFMGTEIGQWAKKEVIDPLSSWLWGKFTDGIFSIFDLLGDAIVVGIQSMWKGERAGRDMLRKRKKEGYEDEITSLESEKLGITDPAKIVELNTRIKETQDKIKLLDDTTKANKAVTDKIAELKNNLIGNEDLGATTTKWKNELQEYERILSLIKSGKIDQETLAKYKLNGMSRGGVVPGTGDKDNVFTGLYAGDAVINKKAVQKYGIGFLKGLDTGSIRKAKDGIPTGTPVQSSTAVEQYIKKYASEFQVDPKLIAAVIKQESGGVHASQDKGITTSGAGAVGIMQLMPSTASWLGVDPYNLEDNIKGGTKYLSQQLKTFNGDKELALAAYNAGPGNVLKYGRMVPPFKETQDYVKNIMKYYGEGVDSSKFAGGEYKLSGLKSFASIKDPFGISGMFGDVFSPITDIIKSIGESFTSMFSPATASAEELKGGNGGTPAAGGIQAAETTQADVKAKVQEGQTPPKATEIGKTDTAIVASAQTNNLQPGSSLTGNNFISTAVNKLKNIDWANMSYPIYDIPIN